MRNLSSRIVFHQSLSCESETIPNQAFGDTACSDLSLQVLRSNWDVRHNIFHNVPPSLKSRLWSTASSLFRGFGRLIFLCHQNRLMTSISLVVFVDPQQISSQLGAAAPPDGVIPNFEQPQDVLYTVNLVVEIICLTLVIPFVSLRIYIRAHLMKQIGKEDCKCLNISVRWVFAK